MTASIMEIRQGWLSRFRQPYDRFMRYMSLRWPSLWRLRIDLLVMLVAANGLLCTIIAFGMHTHARAQGSSAGFLTMVSAFSIIGWVAAVTRSSRLREVIRFSGYPHFWTIALSLLCIAIWPIVLQMSFAANDYGWYVAFAAVLDGSSLVGQFNSIYLLVVVLVVSIFTKLLCLSPLGTAIGATLFEVTACAVFLLIVGILPVLFSNARASGWAALVLLAAYVIVHIGLAVRASTKGSQSLFGQVLVLSLLWGIPIIVVVGGAIVVSVYSRQISWPGDIDVAYFWTHKYPRPTYPVIFVASPVKSSAELAGPLVPAFILSEIISRVISRYSLSPKR